ncbi:MAG TPA: DNA-processing protein DprA [Candidatus Competibacteraceae bacterium]|nr:DNA-processing protein DprA [Candidatus Competibacteraceae bacterium]
MNAISQDPRPWLALWRCPGIGPARFLGLLERYAEPAAVLAAPRAELAAFGLPEAALDWLAAPDWAAVEQDLAWLAKPRNHLIHWRHPDYPALLRQIPDPPPLLFVHGNPACLSLPQLAVVGSRHPTPDGRRNAREFAAHLAANGLLIGSGLALGIDSEAHQGALEAGGLTLAVMGTGPDRIYPARHRELAYAIAERGALVSELPPGTPPLAEHFPRRNRILSGLSLGVLVVEAALQSGSLITARLAAEQGREVFAIPGSIHNALARGCHALIRQGAKLVETAQDILEELGALARATLPPEAAAGAAAEAVPELDADYRELLAQMGDAPVSVDLLVQRTGLTAEVVSSMLLILELRGYVCAAPGGFYSRLRPG